MTTAFELGCLSAMEKVADLAEDFKVPELQSTRPGTYQVDMPKDLRGWLDFYKKQIHTNDIDLNRLKAIPTPSEDARNAIDVKQLNENAWRSKVNLINEQVGAMQPNQQPPQEQPKAKLPQEQPKAQPPQEQPKAPNQGELMSYLKNPYVLGGLGVGALGLGGYAAYKAYQGSKKKKKPASE
jgi:hypothetical protein